MWRQVEDRKNSPSTTSAHRLPDPGPFSLTGGFKTQQAAGIAQQLVVTYLNVGGLNATKLPFILAYMKTTNTDVLICSDARLLQPRRGMTLTLSNHMACRFLVTFNYGLFNKKITFTGILSKHIKISKKLRKRDKCRV